MDEAAALEKLSPCNAPTLTYIQRNLVPPLSNESVDAQLVGSRISLSLLSFTVLKKDLGTLPDAWCQGRMSGSSLFFSTNVNMLWPPWSVVILLWLTISGIKAGTQEALAKAVTTA